MKSQFNGWGKLIQRWLKLLRFIAPAILISVILLSSVSAGENTTSSNLIFQGDDGPLPRIDYHRETGMLSFLGADPGNPLKIETLPGRGFLAQDRALAAANQYGNSFGLKNASSELRFLRENISDGGRASVRYQQMFRGIPVIAGEMMINLNARGGMLSINGELSPDLSLSIIPQISAGAAKDEAISAVSSTYEIETSRLQSTKPELWIYDERLLRPSTRPAQLVWRVEVTVLERLDIRELVLIDAYSGGIPLQFNQIHTARDRKTYDANNTTTLPGTLRCDESNPTCTGEDPHEVGAHVYAGNTYDFYWNYHGRDSIDGLGMTLISTVHYGLFFDNAFWDGNQMVYGDAFGFPLADDVVAHELTHGVTQYTSNLFYYYESGAISESLSDIWGEFVDQTNEEGDDSPGVKWLMGEDITGLGAIRDMAHPPNYGHPDRMTSPLYFETTGDFLSLSDSGGVHINSGVNNKAAYLMTDGDTFNGKTISGLGISKVAAIYYEVQTNYLTSGSGFADLYNFLLQGCLNLIGGSEGITEIDCEEVREATDAVEMNQESSTGFNPEAAVCPPGESSTILFFDDLETSDANWSFSAISGTSSWLRDISSIPYSSSGVSMLWGDDSNTSSDSVAAMALDVQLPAGTQPYLHFQHAFGFQNPNNDGGWLEYSTNGGGSWADAGGFFDEGMDYTGSLAPSNPNNGHAAFVADSHGYVSSRYDLSSLAGSNVRFRWRMSTGPTGTDIGWVVDDVRIYTCAVPNAEVLYLPIAVYHSPANAPTSGVMNGTFESGATQWTESSTFGFDLILNPFSVPFPLPITAQDGVSAVWLGGFADETSTITQQLNVPANSTYLVYWRYITSSDSCGFDYGYVIVNAVIVSTYDLCSTANTGKWSKQIVDLGASAGTLITLQIQATNNGSIISNLFIDNVAFQAMPTSFAESFNFSEPMLGNKRRMPQDWIGEP